MTLSDKQGSDEREIGGVCFYYKCHRVPCGAVRRPRIKPIRALENHNGHCGERITVHGRWMEEGAVLSRGCYRRLLDEQLWRSKQRTAGDMSSNGNTFMAFCDFYVILYPSFHGHHSYPPLGARPLPIPTLKLCSYPFINMLSLYKQPAKFLMGACFCVILTFILYYI